MSNVEKNEVTGEIEQYKLDKIRSTEKKIHEYNKTFNSIKENIVIKYTKNATSIFFRILLGIIILVLILIVIRLSFSQGIINELLKDSSINNFQPKEILENVLPYIILISQIYFIILAVLLFIILKLLKYNNKKCNTIFKLSKLFTEIINYMDISLAEEKKRYECYVENMSQTKNRGRNDSQEERIKGPEENKQT